MFSKLKGELMSWYSRNFGEVNDFLEALQFNYELN